MRLLITGINGFVGGHLADYLLHTGGDDIWGLARSSTLAWPHLHGHVQFVQADLLAPAQVSQALAQVRPDVIFHLASQTFIPESFRDPAATLSTNIFAQLHLFLATIEHRLTSRMLVVTSNEVYGRVPPAGMPINEDTPLRPATPYGVSKAAQDLLASQYHQSHQLDIVRVRPFNHIGPRQTERFVAASFACQIARIEQGLQSPIIQVGDLSTQRDFTDVRDMVRAYALAVTAGESGQVYNLGSGQPVAIQTLLDTLVAASQVAVEIQRDPARIRPVDLPLVACDATRFRQRTGWQPAIPLTQTLHDILEDCRIRIRTTSPPA